jgi:hypothetical protein
VDVRHDQHYEYYTSYYNYYYQKPARDQTRKKPQQPTVTGAVAEKQHESGEDSY